MHGRRLRHNRSSQAERDLTRVHTFRRHPVIDRVVET